MLNTTKRKHAPLCNYYRTCRQRMDKQYILVVFGAMWCHALALVMSASSRRLRAKILHNEWWSPSSVFSYFLAVTIRYRQCWIFSCLRNFIILIMTSSIHLGRPQSSRLMTRMGNRILIWGFQRWQRLQFPFRKILDIRVRWGLADGIFHLSTLNP